MIVFFYQKYVNKFFWTLVKTILYFLEDAWEFELVNVGKKTCSNSLIVISESWIKNNNKDFLFSRLLINLVNAKYQACKRLTN